MFYNNIEKALFVYKSRRAAAIKKFKKFTSVCVNLLWKLVGRPLKSLPFRDGETTDGLESSKKRSECLHGTRGM